MHRFRAPAISSSVVGLRASSSTSSSSGSSTGSSSGSSASSSTSSSSGSSTGSSSSGSSTGSSSSGSSTGSSTSSSSGGPPGSACTQAAQAAFDPGLSPDLALTVFDSTGMTCVAGVTGMRPGGPCVSKNYNDFCTIGLVTNANCVGGGLGYSVASLPRNDQIIGDCQANKTGNGGFIPIQAIERPFSVVDDLEPQGGILTLVKQNASNILVGSVQAALAFYDRDGCNNRKRLAMRRSAADVDRASVGLPCVDPRLHLDLVQPRRRLSIADSFNNDSLCDPVAGCPTFSTAVIPGSNVGREPGQTFRPPLYGVVRTQLPNGSPLQRHRWSRSQLHRAVAPRRAPSMLGPREQPVYIPAYSDATLATGEASMFGVRPPEATYVAQPGRGPRSLSCPLFHSPRTRLADTRITPR